MRRPIAGCIVAGAVLAAVGALAAAAPASADIVDDGTPGMLTIDAEPLELQLDLDPGDRGDWLLTVRLDTDTPGDLDLRVTSEGELVSSLAGLRLSLDECSAVWTPAVAPGTSATCPATASVLLAPTPFADLAPSDIIDLGTLDAHGVRFLRATIELPDPAPGELQGGDARFSLGFAAAGETVVVDGSGPDDGGEVAQTGVALAAPLALAAALAAVGVFLRAAGARPRRGR